MRYYDINFIGNSESLKECEEIRQNHYGTSLYQLNDLVMKNIENDMVLFFYGDNQNGMKACFSYNENKLDFDETYNYLIDLLNGLVSVRFVISTYYEITMPKFINNINEGRRRDHVQSWNQIIKTANLWYYSYYNDLTESVLSYKYEEKIVEECDLKTLANTIYDSRYLEELANIQEHPNNSDLSVNMAHYFISGRSIEATSDMVTRLAGMLLKANRIQTARIVIISEISPGAYISVLFSKGSTCSEPFNVIVILEFVSGS